MTIRVSSLVTAHEIINKYGRSLLKQLTEKDDNDSKKSSLAEKNDNDFRESLLAEKDVIYRDAEYERDDEAQRAVSQLSESKYINKKVVITTAVMDNGISFKDTDLRNVVILADTEEEFIQMLGRKRKDGGDITLYVCRQGKEHFSKRLQNVKRKINAYNIHRLEFDRLYISPSGEILTPFLYYGMGYFPSVYMQQPILDSILQSESFSYNVKDFVYFYQGVIAKNIFSVTRLLELEKFYEDIIERLEDDNLAFVKKIYEWLGFEEEEIKKRIEIDRADIEDIYRTSVLTT